MFFDFWQGKDRGSVEEGSRFIVVGEIERLCCDGACCQRGIDDPSSLVGHDGAESMLKHEPAGGEAQASCEHAVVGSGSSAALEVPEDDAAGLDPGLFLDRLGDDSGDASQPEVAERIGTTVECQWLPVGKLCPFRDDHEAAFLAGRAAPGEHTDQVG